VAGAFGFLFSWCYGPQINGESVLSPLAALTFDLRGVALAGWTLVAFAIGAVAGIVIRRVVPAMFATLVAWSGLAVLTGTFLRHHYEAPLVTGKLNLPNGAWVMSQHWTRGGKTVSLAAVNQILQRLGVQEFSPGRFGQTPGSPPANVSPARYLLHHGFTQLTIYQPASRFWPFQWIEGGWLLVLSLLLIGTAVWLVQRRAA
jgi:hypothetical protein